MEYQKIANYLDSAANQPSKCRPKNWLKEMMNQEEGILQGILY